MGIVGRRGSIARDVKKRCACLVWAHAFSQPRGNGRAGVGSAGGRRRARVRTSARELDCARGDDRRLPLSSFSPQHFSKDVSQGWIDSVYQSLYSEFARGIAFFARH